VVGLFLGDGNLVNVVELVGLVGLVYLDRETD